MNKTRWCVIALFVLAILYETIKSKWNLAYTVSGLTGIHYVAIAIGLGIWFWVAGRKSAS